MKTKINFLFLLLLITFCSCTKSKYVTLDINSISVYFDEQLIDDNKPVCLRFNIYSKELFPKAYSFEDYVVVKSNSILIKIDKIRDNGKCNYDYLSSLSPENIDSLKCAASGDFIINNLQRGNYNFEIDIFDQQFKGELILSDKIATLNFDDTSNVEQFNKSINIVPDSCIFGTYYYLNNSDNNHFNDFVEELKSNKCKEINLLPGHYRAFEVDKQGKIFFNQGQIQNNEIKFIFKYDMNIDEIVSVLNNFINRFPETYGVIMRDSNGNYFNIKKPSN